jgi:hypothetical protein
MRMMTIPKVTTVMPTMMLPTITATLVLRGPGVVTWVEEDVMGEELGDVGVEDDTDETDETGVVTATKSGLKK